jgi:hypothetical protein
MKLPVLFQVAIPIFEILFAMNVYINIVFSIRVVPVLDCYPVVVPVLLQIRQHSFWQYDTGTGTVQV